MEGSPPLTLVPLPFNGSPLAFVLMVRAARPEGDSNQTFRVTLGTPGVVCLTSGGREEEVGQGCPPTSPFTAPALLRGPPTWTSNPQAWVRREREHGMVWSLLLCLCAGRSDLSPLLALMSWQPQRGRLSGDQEIDQLILVNQA